MAPEVRSGVGAGPEPYRSGLARPLVGAGPNTDLSQAPGGDVWDSGGGTNAPTLTQRLFASVVALSLVPPVGPFSPAGGFHTER